MPPNSEVSGGCVQVWGRTTSIRAKDTTRAAALGGPRLSIHGRAGEERRTDSSRWILSHCFWDVMSSKLKGPLELPPEKCTVEGAEKEREEGDKEEGRKQKQGEDKYREGNGERKKEEEGGMNEKKSRGRCKETGQTFSLIHEPTSEEVRAPSFGTRTCP